MLWPVIHRSSAGILINLSLLTMLFVNGSIGMPQFRQPYATSRLRSNLVDEYKINMKLTHMENILKPVTYDYRSRPPKMRANLGSQGSSNGTNKFVPTYDQIDNVKETTNDHRNHYGIIGHVPAIHHGAVYPHQQSVGHGAIQSGSLPKFQFVHFMNPVQISAKKFKPKDEQFHFQQPLSQPNFNFSLLGALNNFLLNLYCAFNRHNGYCLNYYGQHEDLFGSDPFFTKRSH